MVIVQTIIIICFVMTHLSNTLSLGSTFKSSKFTVRPTTTIKVEKNEDTFAPDIHPDKNSLLVKNDKCVVINAFSIIERNHDITNCHASYLPIKLKALDDEGKPHVLSVFLGNIFDNNELKYIQNETKICRKIRR